MFFLFKGQWMLLLAQQHVEFLQTLTRSGNSCTRCSICSVSTFLHPWSLSPPGLTNTMSVCAHVCICTGWYCDRWQSVADASVPALHQTGDWQPAGRPQQHWQIQPVCISVVSVRGSGSCFWRERSIGIVSSCIIVETNWNKICIFLSRTNCAHFSHMHKSFFLHLCQVFTLHNTGINCFDWICLSISSLL